MIHYWSLKQGIVGKIITQTYVVIIIEVLNNTIFKELVKILPGSFEIIFNFKLVNLKLFIENYYQLMTNMLFHTFS